MAHGIHYQSPRTLEDLAELIAEVPEKTTESLRDMVKTEARLVATDVVTHHFLACKEEREKEADARAREFRFRKKSILWTVKVLGSAVALAGSVWGLLQFS